MPFKADSVDVYGKINGMESRWRVFFIRQAKREKEGEKEGERVREADDERRGEERSRAISRPSSLASSSERIDLSSGDLVINFKRNIIGCS